MKATDEINWKEDPIFRAYSAPHLTDEFKEWWVGHFGDVSGDVWSGVQRADYWGHCGWALAGWLAGRKQALEATNRE